jgi:hypothetical protein
MLRALSRSTGAAVRMAVHSQESVLHRVLEIERAMPFSWVHTAPRAWSETMAALREDYRQRLRQAGVAERYADDVVVARTVEVVKRQPCLAMHLAFALKHLGLQVGPEAPRRLKDSVPVIGNEANMAGMFQQLLRKAASDARTRNDGRNWPTDAAFRTQFPGLPSADLEAPRWAEPVLDAPCVSAAIALGIAAWTPEVEGMIRVCRAFDGFYFEEAFLYAFAIETARQRNDLRGAA